ncbi:MAG TPA: hypothetical protein V6C72_00850, partial [Chroococcales cyanobacterium]
MGGGLFFSTAGLVYYANPWMGSSVDVPSEANQSFKQALLIGYLVASFILMLCWLKWVQTDHRENQRALLENQETQES